jgi:hypothetical protein
MPARAKRRWFNSPLLVWPLAALMLIAAFAVTYYFVWASSRENGLDDENFRVLAGVSDQLRLRFDNIASILASTRDVKDFPAYLAAQAPQLRPCDDKGQPIKGGRPFEIRPADPVEASGRVQPVAGPPRGAGSVFARQDNKHCVVAFIDSTLQPFLESTALTVFDDVLLADNGRIVFQTGRTGARITSLSALADSDDSTGNQSKDADPKGAAAKKEKKAFAADSTIGQPEAGAPGFARVLHRTIAGEDYRVYLMPVASMDETHSLVLAAIVRQTQFREQSLAPGSPTLLSLALFIAIVITGSWPCLKFVWRRRTERVLRISGVLLVLTTLLTTALFTLFALDIEYRSLDQARRLKTIADHIDKNVADETRAAFEALDRATRQIETGASGRSPCVSDPNIPDCRENILRTDRYLFASYPYLDQMMWVDRDGNQIHKWSVKSVVTPQINVRGQGFFQQIVANRVWALHSREKDSDALKSLRFRIDPVYSPTTGEYLAILAKPLNPGSDAAGPRVASIVAPLASLIYPILPPDYGFAIVDPDGTVLFHSDPTRNLRENLFEQSRQAETIRAALASYNREPFTADYDGGTKIFLASRMTEFENCPWTIVVYADQTSLSAWHLEKMLVAGGFTIAYGMGLALMAIVVVICLPSYPAAWMWPVKKKRGVYLQLAFSYGAIFLAWILGASHRSPRHALPLAWLVIVIAVFAAFLANNGRRGYLYLLSIALLIVSWPTEDRFELSVLAAGIGFLAIPAAERLAGRLADRFRFRAETCYASAGVALVFLTASAPCINFFQIANNFEERLHLKRDQMATFGNLQRRSERIVRSYAGVKMGDGLPNESAFDPVRALFLKNRLVDCTWDRQDLDGDAPPRTITALAPQLQPQATGRVARVVASIPNPPVAAARNLAYDDESPDHDWIWSPESLTRLRLTRNSDLGRLFDRIAREDIDFLPPSIAGYFSTLTGIRKLVWLTLIVMAVILQFWLRFTIQKIFIIPFSAPEWPAVSFTDPSAANANLIFCGEPGSGKTRALGDVRNCVVVDLAQVNGDEDVNPSVFWSPLVVLDHFEYKLGNAEAARTRLRLLEDLIAKNRHVWIVSDLDPQFYFDWRVSGVDEAPSAASAGDMERWQNVFSRFRLVRPPLIARSQMQEAFILHWNLSTTTEKIVLHQLAKDGWINERNAEALRHLIQRGLIRFDVGFRFRDERFRQYLLDRITPDEVSEWEREEGAAVWDGLKVGLILLLAAMLAVSFFYAQQQALAWLTTGASAMGTVWKTISAARGKPSGGTTLNA